MPNAEVFAVTSAMNVTVASDRGTILTWLAGTLPIVDLRRRAKRHWATGKIIRSWSAIR